MGKHMPFFFFLVYFILPAFSNIVPLPPTPGGTITSPSRSATTAPPQQHGSQATPPGHKAITPGCTTIGQFTTCWVGVNKLTVTAEDSQYLFATPTLTSIKGRVTSTLVRVVASLTTVVGGNGGRETGLVVPPVATSLARAIQTAVAQGLTDDQIKRKYQGEINTSGGRMQKDVEKQFSPEIVMTVSSSIVFFSVVMGYFRKQEKNAVLVAVVVRPKKPEPAPVPICTDCQACTKTLFPGKPTMVVTRYPGPPPPKLPPPPQYTAYFPGPVIPGLGTQPFFNPAPLSAPCQRKTGYCDDDCSTGFDETACAIQGPFGSCHCNAPCSSLQCKQRGPGKSVAKPVNGYPTKEKPGSSPPPNADPKIKSPSLGVKPNSSPHPKRQPILKQDAEPREVLDGLAFHGTWWDVWGAEMQVEDSDEQRGPEQNLDWDWGWEGRSI